MMKYEKDFGNEINSDFSTYLIFGKENIFPT